MIFRLRRVGRRRGKRRRGRSVISFGSWGLGVLGNFNDNINEDGNRYY